MRNPLSMSSMLLAVAMIGMSNFGALLPYQLSGAGQGADGLFSSFRKITFALFFEA